MIRRKFIEMTDERIARRIAAASRLKAYNYRAEDDTEDEPDKRRREAIFDVDEIILEPWEQRNATPSQCYVTATSNSGIVFSIDARDRSEATQIAEQLKSEDYHSIELVS